MSLSQLQALVLKGVVTDAIINCTTNPTTAAYQGDFRAAATEMFGNITEPRRTAIKAGMLLCDQLEATFDRSALTREAQASDSAKAAKAKQLADQVKPNAASAISGLRAIITAEESDRKRGGSPKIDLDVSRQRLAELEGDYTKKFGSSALANIKA